MPKTPVDRRTGQPSRRGESGMILVAAMMLLAILSVLAAAGISTSSLEVQISANDRDTKQAFYLCEAGLETAKYDIVKGWGEGTGGGTFPNFTFTFDAATMPDAVKATTPALSVNWSADRWVGFSLADGRGLEYTIQAHSDGSGGVYQIDDCMGPVAAPQSGYARIFYRNNGVAYSGSGTPDAVSNGIVNVSPNPGWTAGQWVGLNASYWARETATGNLYEIVGNSADSLTFAVGSGVPGSGDFEILLAVGGSNQLTLYRDPDTPGTHPGGPNADWRANDRAFDGAWTLLDAAGNRFAITGTSYAFNPDRMVVTVAGTPADGEFQLVTSPWLVATTATSVTFGTGAGLQTGYGGADLAVAPHPSGAAGTYVVSAVSTGMPTGNVKEIRIDVGVAEGSQPQIGNWRLVR